MAYVEVETERQVKIVSWGSVIAGATTALAVSLLLSFLATAMGLGRVDADAANPVAGVGSTFGWSSAIFLLISLGAGGYVAGYLSGIAGWVHGFLTWALAMLVAAWLSVSAVGGVVNVAGNVMGGVANITGSAASAATSAVGGTANLVGDAVGALTTTLEEQVFDEVDIDITAQLSRAAQQADFSALEPQLIQQELAGARGDLAQAAQSLAIDPTDFRAIVDELLASLRARVETLNSEINRDDIVAAIADNTTLNEAQVEEAADRAVALYGDLAAATRAQIEALDRSISTVQARLLALEDRALEQGERAADAAAGAALWAFFGALLGAAVAVGAGIAGTRSPAASRTRY